MSRPIYHPPHPTGERDPKATKNMWIVYEIMETVFADNMPKFEAKIKEFQESGRDINRPMALNKGGIKNFYLGDTILATLTGTNNRDKLKPYIDVLLDKGAEVTDEAFTVGCASENVKTVKTLIEKRDKDKPLPPDALVMAASYLNVGVMSMLIKEKATSKADEALKAAYKSPLHLYCSKVKKIKAMTMLLKATGREKHPLLAMAKKQEPKNENISHAKMAALASKKER